MPETHSVTRLLDAVRQQTPGAQDRLWEAVHSELHLMARQRMADEHGPRTLQPTALVNEAYLRLFAGGDGSFENRRHFFAAAARAMHRICVDDARRRKRLKRGGGVTTAELGQEPAVFDRDHTEVLAVDEALTKLEVESPELAELVRLKYFVGLSLDETADTLGIARRTVVNQWRLARAWLHAALADDAEQGMCGRTPDGDETLGAH